MHPFWRTSRLVVCMWALASLYLLYHLVISLTLKDIFRNKASNPEWSRLKRYTTHSGTRTSRSGMRQKCSGISCVPVLVGTITPHTNFGGAWCGSFASDSNHSQVPCHNSGPHRPIPWSRGHPNHPWYCWDLYFLQFPNLRPSATAATSISTPQPQPALKSSSIATSFKILVEPQVIQSHFDPATILPPYLLP
jgi:hypothetical protein